MGRPRTAVAKISSLSGSFCGSMVAAASRTAGCSAAAASTRRGDMRNGSGKTMSKATAAAPMSINSSVRVASVVRGQGHCPISASDASSMSTMRTGCGSARLRGQRRCSESKPEPRNEETGPGSVARRAVQAASTATPNMTGHVALHRPRVRATCLCILSRYCVPAEDRSAFHCCRGSWPWPWHCGSG